VLVSGWCLEELAAARVELRIGQSNLASQRVAAKAGFSHEGIVRSHVAATGLDYEDLLFVRPEHSALERPFSPEPAGDLDHLCPDDGVDAPRQCLNERPAARTAAGRAGARD
jgi:hypothetical protein